MPELVISARRVSPVLESRFLSPTNGTSPVAERLGCGSSLHLLQKGLLTLRAYGHIRVSLSLRPIERMDQVCNTSQCLYASRHLVPLAARRHEAVRVSVAAAFLELLSGRHIMPSYD